MANHEIRAGALALAFLGLTAAPAFPQQPERAEPSAKRELIESVIEDLTGDPAAALARVERALQTASAEQRPSLLVRLAELHRRLGHVEAAREAYARLAVASPGLRGWALARKAELPVQQDPERAVDPVPDALRGWIHQLDVGEYPAHPNVREPYGRLRDLGVLAVPGMLALVDDLGPAGVANVFSLIARYDDPRVTQKIEEYLASGDPIRRVAAADAIRRVPRGARVRLGEIALSSDAPRVQLAGAQALLGTGAVTDTLVDRLVRWARDSGSPVHREAVELLADPSLRDVERIDETLESIARDDDGGVRDAAIAAWFDRHPDTARRIAFFESLTPKGQSLAADMMAGSGPLRDVAPELRVRALGRASLWEAEQLFRAMPLDALRRAPQSVREVLQTLCDPRSADPSYLEGFMEYCVAISRQLRMTEVAPVLAEMLNHPESDFRTLAFGALADLAPEMIAERADELLPEFRDEVLQVVVDSATPDTVPELVALVRNGTFTEGFGATLPGPRSASRGQIQRACDAISARSGATNLDAVLDLVTVPAPGVRIGDWNARCGAAHTSLHRWFGPEHVDAALARIDDLDAEVAEGLLHMTGRLVGPEHRPAVIAALERARARGLDLPAPVDEERMLVPVDPETVAHGCIELLATIGDAASVDALLGMVGDPDLGEHAVEYLLRVEGFDPRALYARVLHDPDLWQYANAAFRDPLTASDPELRAAATEALLAWPAADDPDPNGADTFLSRLPVEERTAVATKILERLQAGETLHWTLARDVLEVLGDLRDPALVPVLAIGLQHPYDEVREAAVVSLQRTFSPDAAPHLIAALKDDDDDVVRAARTALERIESYLEEAVIWGAKFEQIQQNLKGRKEDGGDR